MRVHEDDKHWDLYTTIEINFPLLESILRVQTCLISPSWRISHWYKVCISPYPCIRTNQCLMIITYYSGLNHLHAGSPVLFQWWSTSPKCITLFIIIIFQRAPWRWQLSRCSQESCGWTSALLCPVINPADSAEWVCPAVGPQTHLCRRTGRGLPSN